MFYRIVTCHVDTLGLSAVVQTPTLQLLGGGNSAVNQASWFGEDRHGPHPQHWGTLVGAKTLPIDFHPFAFTSRERSITSNARYFSTQTLYTKAMSAVLV